MINNILYNIFKGVNSDEPFLYKHRFTVESKQENFIYIISKVGEVIGNKDYSIDVLDNYNKEKHNIYVNAYGDVTKYPKEIDELDDEGLVKMCSHILLKGLEEEFKILNIEILTSDIKYDVIDKITFGILELQLQNKSNTKTLVLDSLLAGFHKETQYSISKFYEILIMNYNKYGRTDGILIIDTFDNISYKAVFSALMYFYYTNDVELIEHNNNSFKLKLLALENNQEKSISQFPVDISPQLEKLLLDKNIESFKVTKDSNGQPHMIFSKSYINSKDNSFIDICNKHPHAKIEIETYEGKPTGYQVTDKTKPGKNIKI